jgi:hypothetical protein
MPERKLESNTVTDKVGFSLLHITVGSHRQPLAAGLHSYPYSTTNSNKCPRDSRTGLKQSHRERAAPSLIVSTFAFVAVFVFGLQQLRVRD